MSTRQPSALAARLRRELAAKGCTAFPTCSACGQQVAPKNFASSGVCRSCDAERRDAFDAWDREQAAAVRAARFGDLGLPNDVEG